MPKKGYKQSKEHIQKRMPNANLNKKPKPKRKKNVKPVEETPLAPYRDYRCDSYQICLRNAAFFDLVLDCTDCQNCKHSEPKPSDIYEEIIMDDTISCCNLLNVIFYPDKYVYKHHENIMKDEFPEEDAPLSEIEWL